MPIWRVFVKEINARRGEGNPGPLRIEVKPTIGRATVEDMGNARMGRIEYTLNIFYGQGFAEMKIGGEMLVIGEDAEKIENGQINDAELARAVLQRIFVEPLAVAVYIAKELGLPLPIRVPLVKVEEK